MSRTRISLWLETRRTRALVRRLGKLRREADRLGLIHTNNRLAVALAEIIPEARAEDWGGL